MSNHSAYNFDVPIERRGTASLKWDKYQDRDIIPLWVADMDFQAAPEIIAALHKRVDQGVFGYTYAPPELVRTVTTYLRTEYGWSIDPSWLVWLLGVVCGLNVICRAIGCPGDAVLTFTPIYPPFLSAPELSSRHTITVPLRQRQGRWVLDPDALERAITPRTRLLLLCSPHNPVGRAWSRAELEAIAEVAGGHRLFIGSVEIYAGLILDPGTAHVPLASLSPQVAARTVTLMAPSKTFNLPGLGCAFAVISNDKLREAFEHAMAGIVPHVNVLGYVAAQAAYEYGEPWRQALLAYLRGNRDLIEQEVRKMPGLSFTHTEATYLAWIDTRPRSLADPVGFFEKAGVGLSDGTEFAAPGFVRLNFGCPRVLLREALRRMQAALTLPAG